MRAPGRIFADPVHACVAFHPRNVEPHSSGRTHRPRSAMCGLMRRLVRAIAHAAPRDGTPTPMPATPMPADHPETSARDGVRNSARRESIAVIAVWLPGLRTLQSGVVSSLCISSFRDDCAAMMHRLPSRSVPSPVLSHNDFPSLERRHSARVDFGPITQRGSTEYAMRLECEGALRDTP